MSLLYVEVTVPDATCVGVGCTTPAVQYIPGLIEASEDGSSHVARNVALPPGWAMISIGSGSGALCPVCQANLANTVNIG